MGWSDMGLGRKMAVAVAPVLVFFAIVAGWTWVGMNGVMKHVEGAEFARGLQMTILQREIDHLKWAQTVSIYVNDERATELAAQVDPTQCGFGKWFHGPERAQAEARFPELKNLLARIEQPHRKLHESAAAIGKLRAAADPAGARAVFEKESLAQLRSVQEILGEMRAVLEKHTGAAGREMREGARETRNAVLIMASLAILLGGSLSVAVIRAVLRPLKATVDYARAVHDGRTDARLDVCQRDEVGLLASGIKEMCADVHAQMAFSQGVMRGVAAPFSVFSAQDTTTYTNQAMLDLMEIPGKPEDYIGKQSGEYIYGEKGRETLSTRALRERTLLFTTTTVRTRTGKTRHVQVSSAPFFNDGGELLGTVSVWLDQTEAVEAKNAAEQKTNGMIAAAERLEQVAESMSSASEELSAQVEQSSQGTQIQAGRVAETATAMEQMNSTVLEVARNASQAAESSGEARAKALAARASSPGWSAASAPCTPCPPPCART